MSAEQSKPTGPDLTKGVAADEIPDGGMIGGHVGDEAVLIARRGDGFFAIGATCTQYNGPLSLASRAVQPAQRRSDWCAGVQPGLVLAG